MFLGALAFALTPSDSWLALFGLLVSLAGLTLLTRVIRLARDPAYGGRHVGHAPTGRVYWTIVIVRVFLFLAMAIGAIAWLWYFGTDMNEVRLLLSSPRYVDAQIIGREIVPDRSSVGYVDYAYRVQPTLAPVDRFAVAHSDYPKFTIGTPLEVTYAASAPRVHRVGHITWEYAVRRTLYWLLLLVTGAAYLLLPLRLLPLKRQSAKPRRA